MIYITIIFLFFTIVLVFINNKYFASKFFYGIILSWTVSIIALILYLSQHSFYYTIANKVFNLTPQIWNALIRLNVNLDMAIFLLNTGIVSFIFCLLCFAVSLTSEKRTRRQTRIIYLLLTIFPVFEALFYSPFIFKRIFPYLYGTFKGTLGYDGLQSAFSLMNHIFHLINNMYIIGAVILVFIYYLTYPRIKLMRKYLFFCMISLYLVVGVFCLIFSWVPILIVKPTIMRGFFTYITPELSSYKNYFNYFPYLIFAVFCFVTYSLYKFQMLQTSINIESNRLHNNIDMAKLGVKVFTHSIKNYLLSIQSETEYLKNRLDIEDAESQKSVEIILSSCSCAFDNIKNVTDKLREIKVNLTLIELDQFLLKITNLLVPNDSKVTLKYISSGCLLFLYIDEFYMTEVLHNLIQNALEAIGENIEGEIAITTFRNDRWVTISVRDSGSGIEEDNLIQIFTPFYSTKPSVKNWGVGLAYCREIVLAHYGNIQVDSKVGKGSTFKIILPIPKCELREKPPCNNIL